MGPTPPHHPASRLARDTRSPVRPVPGSSSHVRPCQSLVEQLLVEAGPVRRHGSRVGFPYSIEDVGQVAAVPVGAAGGQDDEVDGAEEFLDAVAGRRLGADADASGG